MIQKATLFIFTILFSVSGLFAQNESSPDALYHLINYKKLRHLQFEKDDLGLIKTNKAEKNKDIELDVQTLQQPDFIYSLSTTLPLFKKKIKSGEKILISFWAKTEKASLETGEAKLLWALNVSENPKTRIRHTMSIGSKWQQYFLPIAIEQMILPKHLRLALQFGFPEQQVLIKNLKFQVFDKSVALSDLPKTKITYPGIETNAPWRKEAFANIEKHRIGNFELNFKDKGINNQKVHVQLKRHHFSWGAALQAKKITKDKAQLEHFYNAFNLAVFENDLKIKFWNKPGRKQLVDRVFDQLEVRNIDVKGHVLIWPGFRHLTPEFIKYQGDSKKVTSLVEKHLDDILTETKGRISRWDVVNEAYTNKDLQRITGSEEILYNGFRELHNRDPEVMRFTNEYGIISKGGLDKKKQSWYYDYIKRMDENTNGKVDGIGIQCHIGSDLTAPEKVLEILDYYATLDKKISISEFTMTIKDPEVRRQYTRDFMIAAFSHPSVSEFLFWGYQDERADIFNADWTPGVMGEAFFSLVHDEWKTEFVETINNGKIMGKGFYGTYEYSYVKGNKVITGEFSFEPGDHKIKIKD